MYRWSIIFKSRGFGWRIVRVILMSLAAIILLVMIFEDRLIYFPTSYPAGFWSVNDLPVREGEVFPGIEDCFFETSDGLKLHGWLCKPARLSGGHRQQIETKMTLLWFHGNAGNLSDRYDMIRGMMKIDLSVFIIDYRGYGRSEGSPTESGLYLDALASWDYLTKSRGIAPQHIIIFGKSLGGAPAVDLASKVQAAGLIVQSSFTSAADVASSVMPFFPHALLRTKMDSLMKIGGVTCPKLFIHSRSDEVIPFALGYRLYEAAPDPKEFYEVRGASHNSTYLIGGGPYFEAIRRFVYSCITD